jgi:hypothetical protein
MRTLKDTRLGDAELRLVDMGGGLFVARALVNGTEKLRFEGKTADEAWMRLHDEIGKANPKYVGYDGARNRFLHFFPNGFRSEGYTAEERKYKVTAKNILDRSVPVSDAVDGSGFGEDVLVAFRNTNLLFRIENARVQEVLRGPNADRFIRAAAKFTLGDTTLGLLEMERALKPHNAANWTIVTYLPFLWRPEQHMFLKPSVTTDFAARVGHRFAQDYEARLNIHVYESLLHLSAKTEAELADLEPHDRIDIQSFIWVVGYYKNETEEPKP